jgi:anti-sigma B factor antagonist
MWTTSSGSSFVKLLNLTNKVHDLMQITKLYTVFDITEDAAMAVKSFGHSAAATGSIAVGQP